MNNINIILVGWYTPYDTSAQNRMELINACFLQIIGYNLLLLANLLPSPDTEFLVGWFVIACIGLIFATNMGYMLYLAISKTARTLYLKLLKYKRDKKLKEIEQKKL